MKNFSSSFSQTAIKKHLKHNDLYDISLFDSLDSTNTYLRHLAENGAETNTVVIAGNQTNGRGRLGRSFFSPDGTGVYISVLLRPNVAPEKAVLITTAAAVAVCRAIENTTKKTPQIKWVNDIFSDNKKVCGILAESAFENGKIKYSVLGVGINVFCPQSGFPEHLKHIAGALCNTYKEDLREQLIAEFLNELADLKNKDNIHDEYKKRCFVIGKNVTVVSGSEEYHATVQDIDQNCCLIIKKDDGKTAVLSSGEISIKI